MADGIIRLDEGWKLDESHHLDQPPNVPPVVPVPVARPTRKGKAMDFIPSKRNNQLVWWKKISTDITVEGPKFGLAAPAITAAKDVADDQVAKMEATDDAKAALDGARAAEAAATAANEAAIRLMVRNWKTLPGYPASGSEGVLGLKGTEPVEPPDLYKTVLKASVAGGQVKIEFVKGRADAVAIYTRLRGTAAWTKLAEDTGSPYIDTRPLADPNVPEVREYMGMGVEDNQEIGLPSDIVSVTFAG